MPGTLPYRSACASSRTRPPRKLRARLQLRNSFRPSGALHLPTHALEERIAEDAIRLSRSVKISDACIEGFKIGHAGFQRRLAMPSIIAVNVLRVNPSTRSGLLASTYTMRGDT